MITKHTYVISSSIVNGGSVSTIVEVDSRTGEGRLLTGPGKSKIPAGIALATSNGDKNWPLISVKATRGFWNSRYLGANPNYTESQLQKIYYNSIVPRLNEIRGDVLNNFENYDGTESPQGIDDAKNHLFLEGVPGVVDTVSKQQNNSNGEPVTGSADAESVEDENEDTSDENSGSSESNSDGSGSTSGKPDFKVISSTDTLRYPEKLDENTSNMDFIRMTAYDYVASFDFNNGFGGGGTSQRPGVLGERLGARFTNAKETIILPMQPNLSSTNSVSYKEDELNPFQLAGAEALAKGLNGNQIPGAFKNLATAEAAEAAAMYFAGKAVGKSILTRATGQVINNNLELLFNGPRMRIFNFTFSLTPRTEKEGKVIRRMIKVLKKNMSPQRDPNYIFLKTPHIFQLQYLYNTGDKLDDHPYLNDFKPCVLSNLVVNFTPDGSYSTYENGSLTKYEVQMIFEEIEPIYADEYTEEDDMGL